MIPLLKNVSALWCVWALTALTWAAPAASSKPAQVPAQAASSAKPLPADLTGRWLNHFQNTTIGLQLNANGQCQLFVDSLTAAKSQKNCRFEYAHDTTYWVFLYDEGGKCSSSADYEFAFNANTQTVYLNIGSSMPVEMKK